MGIPDAEDYVYPVYRLGYPALQCGQCGGLPPLFNEEAFSTWFTRVLTMNAEKPDLMCPWCNAHSVIRYGYTRTGKVRYQCRCCRKVFTSGEPGGRRRAQFSEFLQQLSGGHYVPETSQYRLLRDVTAWCRHRLPSAPRAVMRVATDTLVLPFQGSGVKQRLFVVISTDVDTRKIIQITTNYCRWREDLTLCYQYSGSSESVNTRSVNVTGPELIQMQESRFMGRSQFDDIQYGNASLKRNDPGCIIRPNVAIHGHFQRLKGRFSAVEEHYLAHECVLRGAAITAWADEIRAGTTRLWFVVENPLNPLMAKTHFQFKEARHIGWWGNIWQRWCNGETDKMLGLLTGQNTADHPDNITLSSCMNFSDWLSVHPWSQSVDRLSAGIISQHLICLAYCYNQNISRV